MSGARRAAMRNALRFTVRTGLAGVWVRGRIPPGPAVLAASHHSWWDPFIALELAAGARRRAVLLMDASSLDRYRFARRLGAIGTDEPRSGLAALRDGAVLVLYPEARLIPAGPPGPLAAGAAWFAQRAPARLCSAAVRVLLRSGQYPEAYVVLSEVDVDLKGTRDAVTRRLHDQLRDDLAGLDELNAVTDPRLPLPGLTRAVPGRRSWDERIDAMGRIAHCTPGTRSRP
jgi:1-acyl-sn-glycerol-3-phosphate acyltransferase